ncbi:Mn2+/Fe2+ NRAMP family transporter [Arenibacter algicola]|jgi:Mn2+/Fe2+ NRAMP family transporter|uniref:Divalent metal cation transporter MntH n=1 Tax=Arenibacter algicola TaxID=616991 RepID=A0A221UQD9_9FLAO|nr:Nramp family divalent metal transporter [Arenibacter algicola]ASO03574.1 divalent metal cation transporter MntH [Arenibacter algicola]|tara:strand:+ start:38055 stop:39296 length:1242 start_codon:yes stop_codon:yes gene_type:complete
MGNKSLIKKILLGLSAVGPGLFLIGYNIGTGSVTTMAKTGAEFGMSLFWAVVLSCIFTYVLMVAYGKVTLVTGRTALFNFKQEFKWGWILSLYIILVLIIGELLALMGVMGIVADLVQEGVRLAFNGAIIQRGWIILFFVAILTFFLWFGRYKAFEKVLTVLVILMGLSFMVVFIMVRPDMMDILSGMVPSIPDTPGALGLIAAITGTTCSAAVFVMRSTVVAEKGWGINDLKKEKTDAFVSAFMMLFLSGIIMAVAAGTLHISGMKLDDTVEMISLFEPLGGKLAAFVLIIGITGAGLSTIFPIVLIAPWLLADYRGTPRNIHSKSSRVLIIGAMVFAFGTVFLEERPPALMVFSQAFQACILPAVAVPMFILINKQKLMGNNKASAKLNLGLVAVILFSLLTTWFAITEFI